MVTIVKIAEIKMHTGGSSKGMLAEVKVQITPGLTPGGPPMDQIEVLTVVPVDRGRDTIETISREAVLNAAKAIALGVSVGTDELMQALDKSQTERD